MSNWNTFYTAYIQSSNKIKNIIDTNIIAHFLDIFITNNTLQEEHQSSCVSLISDIILNIIPLSDIPDELQKIAVNSENIAKMTVEIRKFIEDPDSYMNDTVPDLKTKKQSVPAQQTYTPPQTPEPVMMVPKETPAMPIEKTEPVIQQIRTMEVDADKIHGYGTYRKMYPDQTTKNNTESTKANTSLNKPTVENEEVVLAITQDDTLNKKTLTKTPTWE